MALPSVSDSACIILNNCSEKICRSSLNRDITLFAVYLSLPLPLPPPLSLSQILHKCPSATCFVVLLTVVSATPDEELTNQRVQLPTLTL